MNYLQSGHEDLIYKCKFNYRSLQNINPTAYSNVKICCSFSLALSKKFKFSLPLRSAHLDIADH